ncbi:hypothetical protein [Sphingomonas citricola]|nr:hypothetical protein [Sphingomonas citricola]
MSWVQTITVMIAVPGSVIAIIGPRAISTSLVRHLPVVDPAPAAFLL